MANEDLKQRILDISYKHKLSHLGSCLSAVDIIDEIYGQKEPEDKFVLSSGHAALALYAVLEKTYSHPTAEDIWLHHGVHPDRCDKCHLDCSTGSLGQGLPIACGMALADKTKTIYCLISDGECAEGSIWESLNTIQKYQIRNLELYANLNKWGAYDPIDTDLLTRKLLVFDPFIHIYRTSVEQAPFLKGQSAHYVTMKEPYGKT